jgi:hypothetical protein
MSKRARITLDPEAVETEQPEPGKNPSQKPQSHSQNRDSEGTGDTPGQVTAAKGLALNTGTIVKVVALGLAAASLFFLLRNRRP